jgi:hypothetical protein
VSGVVENVARASAASAGGAAANAGAREGGDKDDALGNPLPPHWRRFSEGKSTWYVNFLTGAVQWEEPQGDVAKLPPGWRRYNAAGVSQFINMNTGEVRGELP